MGATALELKLLLRLLVSAFTSLNSLPDGSGPNRVSTFTS